LAEVTDEIRARVDIVELVGQRVALKRAGKDWKGLCPFHDDKNPSFQVSPSLGRYRCWACGEHGDAFTWVMKTQNMEFVEALKFLAAHAGVELPKNHRSVEPSKRAEQQEAMSEALSFFKAQLAKHTDAKAYCERRGMDEQTLQTWEVGYAPDEGSALAALLRKKGHALSECRALFLVDEDSSGGYFDKFRGRLMFPIRDERGELVAFGGRLLGDGHPKYVNSGDTPLFKKSRILYGLHRAKDKIAKDRKAVLVEGYLDVIACHQAGVTTAVASLGTALTEDHAKVLRRWCEGVIVLYDSDSAGQKAAERAIEVLEPEGLKVRICLLAQGEDPDTLLRKEGPGALQKAVGNLLTPTEYRLELLKRRIGVEQDDFWTEAIQVIAAAPTDREVQISIMKLALVHPQLRDAVAAEKSLRADVDALRKSKTRTRAPNRAAVRMTTSLVMTPAERVLFYAFLKGDHHRSHIFEVLRESDLFETTQAAELALAMRRAFTEPPSGPPSGWLHLLETEAADLIAELELTTQPVPVPLEVVEDTVSLLRRKLKARELNREKGTKLDDAALMDRNRRLREINNPKGY
jgi:DNA primase